MRLLAPFPSMLRASDSIISRNSFRVLAWTMNPLPSAYAPRNPYSIQKYATIIPLVLLRFVQDILIHPHTR